MGHSSAPYSAFFSFSFLAVQPFTPQVAQAYNENGNKSNLGLQASLGHQGGIILHSFPFHGNTTNSPLVPGSGSTGFREVTQF